MFTNFRADLNWSKQPHFVQQETTLLERIFNGADVHPASLEVDVKGGDYVISAGERTLYVDVKRRRAGASRFWRGGEPELPVELPASASVGDLFKQGTITTYRLYLFDASDYSDALLIRFSELRQAARKYLPAWVKIFKVAQQTSENNGRVYQSAVAFVPLHALIRAGVRIWKFPLKQKSSDAG